MRLSIFSLIIIITIIFIIIAYNYVNFVPYFLRGFNNNNIVKTLHIGDRIKNIIYMVRNTILTEDEKVYQNYAVDSKMLSPIINENDETISIDSIKKYINENKLILEFYTIDKNNKKVGFYILKYTNKPLKL